MVKIIIGIGLFLSLILSIVAAMIIVVEEAIDNEDK